jgi:hypothetical protein
MCFNEVSSKFKHWLATCFNTLHLSLGFGFNLDGAQKLLGAFASFQGAVWLCWYIASMYSIVRVMKAIEQSRTKSLPKHLE